MDMQKIVAELDDAISSVEMKWTLGKGIEEHPEAKHFVGDGHGWRINIVDYSGTVDGGALHMGRGMVVHLTPALAHKARELARKAV